MIKRHTDEADHAHLRDWVAIKTFETLGTFIDLSVSVTRFGARI